MEELHSLFFDKKDYRKYNLFLSFLKEPTKYMKSTKLDEPETSSYKTLVSDRKELQKDLLFIYGTPMIKEITRGIFKLDTEALQGVHKLKLFYLKQSYKFKIFDSMVQSLAITVKEICEKNFCGHSSVYKMIAQLNSHFNKFSVRWSISRIEGEEKNVRHLLFEIYWSLFGGIKWPFLQTRELYSEIVLTLKNKQINFDEVEEERLLFWLAINDLRLKSGMLLNEDSQTKNISGTYNSLSTLFIDDCKQENELKTEKTFFYKSLLYVVKNRYSDYQIEEERVFNEPNIVRLEQELFRKCKNSELSQQDYEGLQFHLNRARYYVQENLGKWYHYLEAREINFFNKIRFYIEKETIKYIDLVHENSAIIYLIECQKAGLSVMTPLRIALISREGKTKKVERVIEKYSNYPIEFCEKDLEISDVIMTDFIHPMNKNNRDKNVVMTYEWPLLERQVNNIIQQALKIKFEKNEM